MGSRSPIALGERTPEEGVAESEPRASGLPARLAGHSISHVAFIATVQDVGALATAEEADRAAVAVLGELVRCLSWTAAQNLIGCLPSPLRRRVSLRSFDSSMCRFAPQAFLRQIARQERVGISRAAQDTRAVLRALDLILPEIFRQQLRAELASLCGPVGSRKPELGHDQTGASAPGGGGRTGPTCAGRDCDASATGSGADEEAEPVRARQAQAETGEQEAISRPPARPLALALDNAQLVTEDEELRSASGWCRSTRASRSRRETE